MADRVLPSVRLIFACDEAVLDLADGKWVLKHPWSVVMLPPGGKFPFLLENLWVYAQLTDGIGTIDLMVEMRQLRDDGTRRTICSSVSTRLDFPARQQLLAFDTTFLLKKVPFPAAGVYEFYVTVDGQELQGHASQIRVLDRWATP